ncbi:hypothetical protein HDU80_001460 [Chytriomyces hyalinus]|nr:hypothetical protein HDU80_001460 [Chytriomyces hyalinus]
MEDFIAANRAQLMAMNVPEVLWTEIQSRIEEGNLGTIGSETECPFGVDEDGAVVTASDLTAREAVSVFGHQWVFINKEDAESKLGGSPGLLGAVAGLIEAAMPPVQQADSSDETQQTEQQPRDMDFQTVCSNLWRVAFEFDAGDQKMSSVSFDPYAPALLPFDNEPLLGAGILIDTRTSKSYTLLWPMGVSDGDDIDDTDDFEIPVLTRVTRGELTVMPDYSNDEYWKHHYATSKETNTFDWYLPWSTGFSAMLKDLVPTPASHPRSLITVLDVGCGNSGTVGDGMVADGLANMVLHFDVSKEAVHSLAKTQAGAKNKDSDASEKTLPPRDKSMETGVQDHAIFDGALVQGMPFRSSKTGEKLFDWAFDKGTTDGMLSHGVAVVRKMWANMARITDVIVLVSFGKPELRIPMIEEDIGNGWVVDQCLEVDGLGTGWSYYVYLCKQA